MDLKWKLIEAVRNSIPRREDPRIFENKNFHDFHDLQRLLSEYRIYWAKMNEIQELNQGQQS